MQDDTGMPEGSAWTPDQWRVWVARQIETREEIFSRDPDEMVAAYNREVGYMRDYHGRELLELLQNADDAGTGSVKTKRAAIVLSPEGLCVANTGIPFSTKGVKSLMISDNSPKRLNRTRYIGNRGLGFRSILSWTDSPIILSGDLSVGFSRHRTHLRLEELCRLKPAVREKVQEETRTGVTHPIPARYNAARQGRCHCGCWVALWPTGPPVGGTWSRRK